MDLLKDITEQVRGNDRDGSDGRADRRTSNRTPSSESRTSSRATTSAPGDGDGDGTESSRENEHVCAFCRESFDASRGACPHCQAKIVLRGVR